MLTKEQEKMVKRAIEIKREEYKLQIEISTIARELGYEGINVWDEMKEIQKKLKIRCK